MSVADLTSAFTGVKVKESGVSFAGKSLKLDKSDDATEIVEEIKKCQKLEYLNLEGNTVGIDAAKSIGEALEKHPELKRALWKDMFTGRMKDEIPKALEHLGSGLVKAGTQLTELDLSDNAFGPIGVQGLASLLRSPTCHQLEELKLNNNGLGITGAKLLAAALTDCYHNSAANGKPLRLKVFVAGRNRLENEGAKALSGFFRIVGTLETITLPQNGIYFPGITALSESFTSNPNIRTINLNDNTIGPKGAAALSKVLPRLTQLKEINFGDCLLKTSGAKTLATALINNTNLSEVTLGFNEIKREGGIELIKSLSDKPLKSLNLDGNRFGEEGREEITEILKRSGKLNALVSFEEDESDSSGDEEVDDSPNQSDGEAVTIDDFLKNPTEDNFISLGDERKNLLVNEAKSNDTDKFIRMIMIVSNLYSSRESMVRNYSLDVSESLYKELIDREKNNLSLIDNKILVNLGLIKSEDKFKPDWDTKACVAVLKLIRDRDYIPDSTKNMLTVFLN